ncbi:MAG: hypothetical protein D6721_08785 [Gammaproteobacteria bacterium]|nr:MAG: hypothetical protein D6721_08785 [Gammaproteobacteria bacterium]
MGIAEPRIRIDELRATVQHNCNISDARHAGDYSLCVYLMKMREFYRWEKGFAFTDPLDSEDIGAWLRERESLWERLEDEEYRPIVIDGEYFTPFDADAINERLAPLGLVYSAGLGNRNKAHFFLGRLHHHERRGDTLLYISDEEFARDLTAPPAMSLEGRIFIRRQSLRRMIWEKVEEWRWNRPDTPMGRAIALQDFEHHPEASLEAMTENELDTLLLHEQGELEAGRLLGPDWEKLVAAVPHSRLAFQLRAVRDNLADCLVTLPGLIEKNDPGSLHFYFATVSNLRRCMAAPLMSAYEHWYRKGDLGPLQRAVEAGREEWLALGREILALFRQEGLDGLPRIQALIDNVSV